jgi:hypothetical protein
VPCHWNFQNKIASLVPIRTLLFEPAAEQLVLPFFVKSIYRLIVEGTEGESIAAGALFILSTTGYTLINATVVLSSLQYLLFALGVMSSWFVLRGSEKELPSTFKRARRHEKRAIEFMVGMS